MLTVSSLTGFGAGLAGPSAVTVSFIGSTVSTANATNYTFTNHAIGTAAGNRKVVVAVGVSGSSTQSITSMTIGGSGASEIVEQANTDNEVSCALYELAVASGTTATIVVSGGRSANNCGVAVWAVYGAEASASATAADYAAASAADPTLSIDCPINGAIIASSHTNNGGSTFTWSGVTENYDETIEATRTHSGASDAFDTAQSGLDVSAAWSNSLSKGASIAASWGLA